MPEEVLVWTKIPGGWARGRQCLLLYRHHENVLGVCIEMGSGVLILLLLHRDGQRSSNSVNVASRWAVEFKFCYCCFEMGNGVLILLLLHRDGQWSSNSVIVASRWAVEF